MIDAKRKTSGVTLDNLAQFIAVCSNELLLQSRCLELNGDMVAVGGNQTVTTFKADDIGNLRIGEF